LKGRRGREEKTGSMEGTSVRYERMQEVSIVHTMFRVGRTVGGGGERRREKEGGGGRGKVWRAEAKAGEKGGRWETGRG
jgi:hypothetical protein